MSNSVFYPNWQKTDREKGERFEHMTREFSGLQVENENFPPDSGNQSHNKEEWLT